MPVARDGGYENYATNTGNYIPEIYAKKLVKKFYKSTIFGAISNTDYEGEIKNMGDTVHLRTRPDITISNYTVGGGLGTAQTPTKAGIDLLIDKAKYYNVGLNLVDETQMDIDMMDEWSDDAAQQMKIVIDTDVLGNVFTDVAASNAGATAGAISSNVNLGVAATAIVLTPTNIIDYIIGHGQVLDESNCPDEGRWIVLPAWACARIKTSDLKGANVTGDSVSPMRNGKVGQIDRFQVYMSNNVNVAGGEFDIMSGHKGGLTFATQLVKNRIMDDPNEFQKLLQGLQVYGYKVINDTLLTHGVIKAA